MTNPPTAVPAATGPAVTLPVEWAQSLADGAPGIALPHIERILAGTAGWEPVHRLATAMTREPVHAHPEVTNLFRGAPAVAYTLHTAGHPAYQPALATLDRSIATLIRCRLEAAHRRMDAGHLARAREYDLINGLTGLGAYLMHRYGTHDLLRDTLDYLIRLTQPVRVDNETLPGWWATGSPDRRHSPRWDGGHAGSGMAHGIAGPLALLSTAMRHGVIVTGHRDAIHTIGAWLDQWQTGQDRHACWPEVINRDDLQNPAAHTGPHRPTWCYGTPGIARAQQIAGHATGDTTRAHLAEQALLGCLTDERQLARITDAGLCHGWAGLAHTAHRAAADTTNNDLTTAARTMTNRMRRHIREHSTPTDEGFLEGAAGVELVDAGSANPATPTRSRWDACLLVG